MAIWVDPLYCGWEAHYLLSGALRKKPIVIHNPSMHSMDRASDAQTLHTSERKIVL